ncbi:hypothetical protein BHM03_00011761 [Ensete ventricosum]|nr:hypothetical protein BHM03_00011761 [Ensete ventricosum]
MFQDCNLTLEYSNGPWPDQYILSDTNVPILDKEGVRKEEVMVEEKEKEEVRRRGRMDEEEEERKDGGKGRGRGRGRGRGSGSGRKEEDEEEGRRDGGGKRRGVSLVGGAGSQKWDRRVPVHARTGMRQWSKRKRKNEEEEMEERKRGVSLVGSVSSKKWKRCVLVHAPIGMKRSYLARAAMARGRGRHGERRYFFLLLLFLFFFLLFPQSTIDDRFLPQPTANGRFWQNHPVVGGLCTGNLADRYVPPIPGGTDQNCIP